MKRIISLAVVAVMVLAVFALTACGGGGADADYSDSKYIGTWQATSMEFMDESDDLEDVDVITITLKEDGTGTMSGTSEGEEETSSFTWAPTDNGFKTKGDVKLTFTDDGDNIKTKIIGVEMKFERQ